MMLKFRFSAWQFLSVCLHFVIFEFTQSNYGFSCFVLFNFQGPVRWTNQLFDYITLFSVCQHFFQIFFKILFKASCRFNVTACLLYQAFFSLSILFSDFFIFYLFLYRPVHRRFFDSFAIIWHLPPFVNTFFEIIFWNA